MAYDKSLWLLDPAGDGMETVTASGNGTGVAIGANRLCIAELRVGGVVTGTLPTLDIKLEESATLGGSYTPIGAHAVAGSTGVWAFPRVIASMQGEPLAPGTVQPYRIAFLTSLPFVRAVKTIGGTAVPTFTDTSVQIVPVLNTETMGA